MNMDESFNLDDIEQLESEKNALFPNTDEVSVCSCRSACLNRVKAWATIVPKLVTVIQTLNTQNQHAYV